MGRLDHIREQLAAHASAIKGIETIADFGREALAADHPDAAGALAVILKIIDAIIAGYDGKITAAEVDKRIHAALDRSASNDAIIDELIDKKFDNGDDHG